MVSDGFRWLQVVPCFSKYDVVKREVKKRQINLYATSADELIHTKLDNVNLKNNSCQYIHTFFFWSRVQEAIKVLKIAV